MKSSRPRRPIVHRSLAAAVALGVAVAGVVSTSGSAGAADDDSVPSSQPLPGYTISNPPLTPLSVGGAESRVLQGTYQHAGYVVEIPAVWNGDLVMWAHGYVGPSSTLSPGRPSKGLRQKFLDEGYAWAASSYAKNDYNVATGVTTTEGLSTYVPQLIGKRPKRTYIAGESMGGHIIGRSLEEYPRHYSGALSLCGVVGGSKLMSWFLDVNLVAQTLAERDAFPPPPDYYTDDVPVIQDALGLTDLTPGGPETLNARGEQFRSIATELSGGERPGDDAAFAYWKNDLFGLVAADTGGTLAQNDGRLGQNLFTEYSPDTPVDVNSQIERVQPADVASYLDPGLTEIPRIEGRPDVPIMTLHDLGDLFVPFSMEQAYRRGVAANGQSDLLVQRAIRGAGHCEFTPAEAGSAWDDLTTWVEAREKYGDKVALPPGDDVLTASTVADPDYGCRFTDPTAYSSPDMYGTRSFYETCPKTTQVVYDPNPASPHPGPPVVKPQPGKIAPTVSFKLSSSSIAHGRRLAATVDVDGRTVRVSRPTGTITLMEGRKTLKTVALRTSDRGRRSFTLPALRRGEHTLRVVFVGRDAVGTGTSTRRTVRVR